jgi:hypothetical protein
LLSDARILAAYVIFAGSYLVFALGKFPWMKIDRPGAAIIGAVLMVAFRIVGASEALASVDFATVVLLFAMISSGGSLTGSSRSCTQSICSPRLSSPADCSQPFSSTTSCVW